MIQVLEDNLKWLIVWEDCVTNKIIPEEEFLTRSTSEGLRVTMTSTLELTQYLLNDCGFQYVLTNKYNQDCLEVIAK